MHSSVRTNKLTQVKGGDEMAMESYVAKRLEVIERELGELRQLLEAGAVPKRKRKKGLRGIWKGVEFTDQEIEEAKRSLFKGLDEPKS